MASLSPISRRNHSGSTFNASSRCRADLRRSLIVSYPVSPYPRLRLILAHLEDPSSDPNLSPDTPPGDERARQCRIGEIDQSVVQHAAFSSLGRGCLWSDDRVPAGDNLTVTPRIRVAEAGQ